MATLLQSGILSVEDATSILISNDVIQEGSYVLSEGVETSFWEVDDVRIAKYKNNSIVVYNLDEETHISWNKGV